MLPKREQILFCFCGPSGSGKTSICHELLKTTSDLENSISTTTRKPRGTEQDGIDYYFLSLDEFQKRVKDGEFIEHANFSGNSYGTEKRNISRAEKAGHDLLLDIEVQGVQQLKNLFPSRVVTVFVFPPSYAELEKRIRGRGTEDEEKIKVRLQTAKKEIQVLSTNAFSDYLLINDKLDSSLEQAAAIISAERNKYSRQSSEFISKTLK